MRFHINILWQLCCERGLKSGTKDSNFQLSRQCRSLHALVAHPADERIFVVRHYLLTKTWFCKNLEFTRHHESYPNMVIISWRPIRIHRVSSTVIYDGVSQRPGFRIYTRVFIRNTHTQTQTRTTAPRAWLFDYSPSLSRAETPEGCHPRTQHGSLHSDLVHEY